MSQSMWQPVHEPLRKTLVRTGLLPLIGGVLLARWWGGAGGWPVAVLAMFWFTFGGHWVELFFLNWLSPRLPAERAVQVAARLLVWFVGGCVLGAGANFTVRALSHVTPGPLHSWWAGGVALIGIEMVVHLALSLRKGVKSSPRSEPV